MEQVVGVGDGFLAGERDGALFIDGQGFSVLALLTGQVGQEVAQPLVSDPGLATAGQSGGRLVLLPVTPPRVVRQPTAGEPLNPDLDRPYDNLSVPDALLREALGVESAATSEDGNPFYDVVLRGRGTFVEQVAELEATLILLWLGGSDVLRFVRAGGDVALAPGRPTSPSTFAINYELLVTGLLETTDDVVLFNVPDVTLFPVAQTVSPFVINPDTGEPFMNTIVEPVIDPVTGDTTFMQRQVPIGLLGPSGSLTEDDQVVFGARSFIEAGIGVPANLGGTGQALPDRAVLDPLEQLTARDAVRAYNAAIAAVASEHGLEVVDIHALVEELSSEGVISDGVLLTTEYLVGQAFSLDGTHFTAKGCGVIANLLIDVLNERYGGTLPHVRTAALPGIPLVDIEP